jgi:predicted ester cyclase
MEAYLDALITGGDYGAFLDDDVTFTMTETGEVTRGRAGVVGLIDYLHQQAFTATPVVTSVIVDAAQAALEAEFVGTHSGEFAGIAASGREVRVPYAVGYDLAGSAITALRIYLPMEELVRQLRDI